MGSLKWFNKPATAKTWFILSYSSSYFFFSVHYCRAAEAALMLVWPFDELTPCIYCHQWAALAVQWCTHAWRGTAESSPFHPSLGSHPSYWPHRCNLGRLLFWKLIYKFISCVPKIQLPSNQVQWLVSVCQPFVPSCSGAFLPASVPYLSDLTLSYVTSQGW